MNRVKTLAVCTAFLAGGIFNATACLADSEAGGMAESSAETFNSTSASVSGENQASHASQSSAARMSENDGGYQADGRFAATNPQRFWGQNDSYPASPQAAAAGTAWGQSGSKWGVTPQQKQNTAESRPAQNSLTAVAGTPSQTVQSTVTPPRQLNANRTAPSASKSRTVASKNYRYVRTASRRSGQAM
jgi:hypothetical protein